jgi:predicted nuclease of predicted toxin-antitoxin system
LTLADCRYLTDENLHPAIAVHLRTYGLDVQDVKELGWIGRSDEELMRWAHGEQRVIISHDRDFGRLAIVQQVPFWGIVYLRPGHIVAQETIYTLDRLLGWGQEVLPPFLLVCERVGQEVRLRLRSLSTE